MGSTPLSFLDSPISSSFIAKITVLRHALGWCLQHLSTCPFMSLAVFTNSQSSLTLLNYASNLLAPNALWAMCSSITAYLIWLNCPSIGSLATAIYVPMRSQTCYQDRQRHPLLLPAPGFASQHVPVTLSTPHESKSQS